MSCGDSSSSCSSYHEIRNERGSAAYNANHLVDVSYHNSQTVQKNILIVVTTLDNAIKIKLRDSSDYAFNYTLLIDWSKFDDMKQEQCLDITFEELQPQIIELLKQASLKKMFMRLEVNTSSCRVIFYEKSRIKALILLALDMEVTNHRELIEEMSHNITLLKDSNSSITSQLSLTRNQLRDTEVLLKNALAKSRQVETQFRTDLDVILQTLVTHLAKTEANISLELLKLTKRHQKLLRDVEVLKSDSLKKCEASSRLVQSMQSLRLESDQNHRTVGELRTELEAVNSLKSRIEQTCVELRQTVSSKESDIDTMKKQIVELRRDVQDATMIIAQKTKTNDEIGKDLVQANQMIVNFNNHYDCLTKEVSELKEKVSRGEKIIQDQSSQLSNVKLEFETYRSNYSHEEVKKLHHELFLARQRIDELGKQNKEATTLNGLLTKKLSATEIVENRNSNWPPPRS